MDTERKIILINKGKGVKGVQLPIGENKSSDFFTLFN